MTSSAVPESIDADDKLEKELSLWDPEEILVRLSKLPCPMNWEIHDFDIDDALNKNFDVSSDFTECINEIVRYPLTTAMGELFFISLILFHQEKYEEGLRFLLEFSEDKKSCAENVDKALKHYTDDVYCVYYATISWFYFKTDSRDSCLKYLCMAEKRFSDKDIFYLYAKARTVTYLSTEHKKHALLITEKLLIAEDNPEFHWYAGSLMGRIRHFSFPYCCPTPEELQHCEIAYRYDSSNEFYSVILLRCYRDLYCKTTGMEKRNYYQKAISLNRKMLSEGCDHLRGATIAKLLFFSLSYGPVEFSDKLDKVAKNALNIRPNNTLVNDYISRFYLNFKMYKEALPCLRKVAHTLPYTIGLFLHVLNKFKPTEDFEIIISNYLEFYSEKKELYSFYGSVAEFYLLSVKNFEKCCHYFVKMCSYGSPEKYNLSITYYHASFLEVFQQLFDKTKSESPDIQNAYLLLKEISDKKNLQFPFHSMSRIVSRLY